MGKKQKLMVLLESSNHESILLKVSLKARDPTDDTLS